MTRILLLGKNGQVGWELHRSLLPLGDVTALDAPELDYTNLPLLRDQVLRCAPDIIVNAVAYTAVDQAEDQPELVNQVNAHAPGALTEVACQLNAILVHYSTDFVFDGTKATPYTEDDEPHPLSVYARSKLLGDQVVQEQEGAYFVLRSSWIYSARRDNFVKKVLSWARKNREVSVVTDQLGCPTWARDIAEATAMLLMQCKLQSWDWIRARRGIYNLAGSGYASRYEWAEEILRLDPQRSEQMIETLKPALTKDFETPAVRPLYSALDCTRFYQTFGLRLPDWKLSLQLALQDF